MMSGAAKYIFLKLSFGRENQKLLLVNNCDNSILSFLLMLPTTSPFHDCFKRQRDCNFSQKYKHPSILTKGGMRVTAVLWILSLSGCHQVVLNTWWESKTRWKISEATGPDLLDRCAKQISPLLWSSLTALASMEKGRFVPFFPLDPVLDIWVFRLLIISKQDKQPQREEIKDKNGCSSFYWPSLVLDFQLYS